MATESRVQKSTELYERAGELIPGWVQLQSRRASGFAEGVSPSYAASAKGSRFTDVDGNEYIDWVNCYTAVILGHADDVVDGAVKEQIDLGSLFTINSPKEVELAEILVETVPSAEMVRYTKGGGDACAVAARIARGATGRDKIIFSGYHGWHDWYQAANLLEDPATGGFPVTGTRATGVPKALAGTALPFAEGDLDTLRRLLDENKGEVAAIMMEPMRSELPPEGYLETVKELAHANGAILIFDEVSCGFRAAVGGVQEYLGITPDMTTFAKCISNGYPMGAVVGSREVMEPAGSMFISSSYWSDNVGLAASIATLGELKRRDSASAVPGDRRVDDRRPRRRRRVGRHTGPGHRVLDQAHDRDRRAGRIAAPQGQHAVHPGDGEAGSLHADRLQLHALPHRRGHPDHGGRRRGVPGRRDEGPRRQPGRPAGDRRQERGPAPPRAS